MNGTKLQITDVLYALIGNALVCNLSWRQKLIFSPDAVSPLNINLVFTFNAHLMRIIQSVETV